MNKDLSIEQLEQRVTKLENKIKEESLKSRVAKLEKMLSKDKLIFNESSDQRSVVVLVDDKTNKPFPVEGKIYVTPEKEDSLRVQNFNHDMYNNWKNVRFKPLPLANTKLKDYKGDVFKVLSSDRNGRFIVIKSSEEFRVLGNTILHGAEIKRSRANAKYVNVVHNEPWVIEYE